MPCYHPLTAIDYGLKDNGKKNIKVVSGNTEIDNSKDINIISLPCGHCVGCLLERSRQWADRCMLESTYHDSNCFITLTIDDYHLYTMNPIYHANDLIWSPLDNLFSDQFDYDGCLVPQDKKYASLRKTDFQLFMKRLRKKLKQKYDITIRFFACSEYGTKSLRPHYHAIIFGYDFSDDRVLYKQNFNGDKLYNSKLLSDCWPFGHAVIADCNWNTCAYVARYCLKKSDNDLNSFYEHFNCEPEAVFMSRRPGIARDYYDDHKHTIYNSSSIILPNSNGRKIRPPRYFDKLYDVEYPSDYNRVREKRSKSMVEKIKAIVESTDINYFDYLATCEYNKDKRIKLLKQRENFRKEL